MSTYLDCAPACEEDGYCIFDFYNNLGQANRLGRISGFLSGTDNTTVLNRVVPGVLTDYWLYYTLSKVPKEVQLWPRPNTSDAHGIGLASGTPDYGTQQLTIAGNNCYSVPVSIKRFQPQIKTNERPFYDPDEQFNARLGWHGNTGMTIVYTNGNIVANTVPASLGVGLFSAIVGQQAITPDFTINNANYSGTNLGWSPALANTMWFPSIEETGRTMIMAASSAAESMTLVNKFCGTAFFALDSLAYHNRLIIPAFITSAGLPIEPDFMITRPGQAKTAEVDSTVASAVSSKVTITVATSNDNQGMSADS